MTNCCDCGRSSCRKVGNINRGCSSCACLQIKYGNLPERPRPITNEVLSNSAIDFAENQDVLEKKSLKDLESLEDDIEENTMAKYRKARLEELKRKREAYKFGDVFHIGKDEYVAEITEASKASPNQHVVIHLYSEAKPICELLNRAFAVIARRHGDVKFCKAIGSDVIPDFPDSRVPTVLVYKNGSCVQQFLGGSVWGGPNVTPDCVEWVLWKDGVVSSANTEDDPRPNNSSASSRSLKNVNTINDPDSFRDDDSDNDSSEDRNVDRRGYSSLQMERALRLK